MIQEKLTVPEEEEWRVLPSLTADVRGDVAAKPAEAVNPAENGTGQQQLTESYEQSQVHVLRIRSFMTAQGGGYRENTVDFSAGPWEALRDTLTDMELQALSVLCCESGERTIKQFADEHGMMLEVLMDGINEKAMDCVGDSLTDDEFVIYEDYIEKVRKIVKGIG